MERAEARYCVKNSEGIKSGWRRALRFNNRSHAAAMVENDMDDDTCFANDNAIFSNRQGVRFDSRTRERQFSFWNLESYLVRESLHNPCYNCIFR